MSSLLIELSGGTPFGLGHWVKTIRCGKLATLDRAINTQLPASLPEGPMTTGSIVHGLLRQHYKSGLFNLKNIEYNIAVPPKSRKEAEELYRDYRLMFPPDEWTTVETESVYGVQPNKRLRGAISAAVGATPLPYTFAVDIGLTVNQAQAVEFKKRRGIVLKPGFYLGDHKTAGWLELERFRWSLQGAAYILGYEAATKRKPLGMIFNIVMKSGGWQTLVYPYPNALQIKRLHTFFERVRTIQQALGPNWTNPAECVGGRVICPHFTSGACYGF